MMKTMQMMMMILEKGKVGHDGQVRAESHQPFI